jgi:hypothetical protein
MAALLFRLKGVQEDEAEEVRALLYRHGLDYYETPGGNWGISIAAIWLKDESRREEARALIDDYQRERGARVRAEHERLRSDGQLETFSDRLRRRLLEILIYLAIIGTVLYFSVKPFFGFGS